MTRVCARCLAIVASGRLLLRLCAALVQSRHLRFGTGQSGAEEAEPGPIRIVVLLPAFRVKAHLPGALAHYEGLVRSPGIDLTIAILTTEREATDEEHTWTRPVADRLAAARPGEDSFRVIALHSLRRPYCKAAQLNDAAALLSTPSTWFVVVDADCRPSPDLLLRLARATRSQSARAFQLPAITCLDEPGARPGVVPAVDAWMNRYRVLVYEGWNIRVRSWVRAHLPNVPILRAALAPVIYLAGNGFAIRGDLLRSVNGFPEPVEDIPLGNILCARDEDVGWIRSPVYQARYASIARMRSSRRLIFEGVGAGGHLAFQEARGSRASPAVARVVGAKALLSALVLPLEWLVPLLALLVGRRRARTAAAMYLLAGSVLPVAIGRGVRGPSGSAPLGDLRVGREPGGWALALAPLVGTLYSASALRAAYRVLRAPADRPIGTVPEVAA